MKIITCLEGGPPAEPDNPQDASGGPAWVEPVATPATTRWSRNVGGPSGGLVAQISGTGAVAPAAGSGTATCSLQVVNLHGDIVTTLPATTAAAVADFKAGFTQATEYGIPRSLGRASSDAGYGVLARNTGAYGWVGAQTRSRDDLAGLILMGARLYNPATSRFLSVDSVYGGNDNTYNYPNGPILIYDLNGQFWHWLSKTAHTVGNGIKGVGDTIVHGTTSLTLTAPFVGVSVGWSHYDGKSHWSFSAGFSAPWLKKDRKGLSAGGVSLGWSPGHAWKHPLGALAFGCAGEVPVCGGGQLGYTGYGYLGYKYFVPYLGVGLGWGVWAGAS